MKTTFQSRWPWWGMSLVMLGALAFMLTPFAWSNGSHEEKGHHTQAKKEVHKTDKHEEPHHAEEVKPHGQAMHEKEEQGHHTQAKKEVHKTDKHEEQHHAEEVEPHHAEEAKPHAMNEKEEHGKSEMGHGKPEKADSLLIARGRQLVTTFHCDACHVQIEKGHVHGHAMPTPDVTFVGDKLRPDWLFDFLKRPHTLRPWLKIRMPDFRLTDREALTLTKHITQTMRDRKLTPLPPALEYRPAHTAVRLATGKKWIEKLQCAKCHPRELKGLPEGVKKADLAPSFDDAARRLTPAWIMRFLLDPQSIYPGPGCPITSLMKGSRCWRARKR